MQLEVDIGEKMQLKRIVNLVLLIFVAITIVTFIYKENKSKIKREFSKMPEKTALTFVDKNQEDKKEILAVPNERSTEKEIKSEKIEKEKAMLKEERQEKKETSTVKANSGLETITPSSATEEVTPKEEKPKEEEIKKESKPSEKIIVYYFMTTTRCPSCYKIENYTYSCIVDKFSEELSSGKMEWKMVNVDEKENAHFIKDYELFTKSVVLSKQVDGKEVKWVKLDKVWNLLNDQKEFYDYIESEIKKFMVDAK